MVGVDPEPTFRLGAFTLTSGGGKEIRTPDIQLAKLALYQLSYTPVSTRS